MIGTPNISVPQYSGLVDKLTGMYLKGLENQRERERQEAMDQLRTQQVQQSMALDQQQFAAHDEERKRRETEANDKRELDLALMQQEQAAKTPSWQMPGAPAPNLPLSPDQAGPQSSEIVGANREPITAKLHDRILTLPRQYQEEKQAQADETLRRTLGIQREMAKDLVGPDELKSLGLPGDSPIQTSVVQALLNERSRMAAAKESAANREAMLRMGQDGRVEAANSRNLMTITNKFQADKIMGQANTGATIKSIADGVIANPGDATNQLASLYILVKNLDPESAVREGELQLANATQSYLQQWQNVLTRVGKGVVIDPQAAVALANATKQIAALWDQAALRREAQYRAQANQMGVGEGFNSYLSQFKSTYGEMPGQSDGWKDLGNGIRVREKR